MATSDDSARSGPHSFRPGYAPIASGAGSRSGWVYTEGLGERIAELLGDAPAGGLPGLHAAFPDLVPPAAVVRAWCRQYPQFGLRLAAAERVRAETLVEQAIVVADTFDGSPARLALQIAARQYLAERLDRDRFGRTPAIGGVNGGAAAALGHEQPVAMELDDATLARIAAAGQAGEGAGG